MKMKKLFSIILSVGLMGSMFGAISTNAEVKFLDSETFYEPFKNADDVLCYRYYKPIDGVIYSCDENPDWGFYEPSVIAIKPSKPNSKIVIADEITINDGTEDEKMKVAAINMQLDGLNDNVEEIVIGDNITSIEGLRGSSYLKKVVLGKGVYSISNSFNNCCDNLEIVIPAENKNFAVENKELYQITNYGRRLVSVFNSANSYEIKSGVGGFNAPFGRDFTVRSITVNENLTELTTGEMERLTTINIGENVKEIKYIDVSGAVKLKNFDLTGIKATKLRAKGARNLTSIVIPKDCKLSYNAFTGCKKLAKVIINNTKKAPKIEKDAFKNTKSGIKFYVKNKTVAKSLKTRLEKSGVKKAKIYAGKKLIYKNVK